jgi:hypothetical protein
MVAEVELLLNVIRSTSDRSDTRHIQTEIIRTLLPAALSLPPSRNGIELTVGSPWRQGRLQWNIRMQLSSKLAWGKNPPRINGPILHI